MTFLFLLLYNIQFFSQSKLNNKEWKHTYQWALGLPLSLYVKIHFRIHWKKNKEATAVYYQATLHKAAGGICFGSTLSAKVP